MFELTNHQAKVASYNPRAERHGADKVSAGDLKVEITGHSSLLDHFDKGLRKTLYRKPAPGEQTDLPLGDDNLTQRKLPRLAPLRWVQRWRPSNGGRGARNGKDCRVAR